MRKQVSIKTYTTDRIAQQRAQRQFEAIGEKVGESLLPIFEMEGARLDEGTRTAVALAVADTLNAATSQVLAQYNLDPADVAKNLLGLHPARSYHFSDDEGQLYERIVIESCTYIVDIASQLPQFTERTLAEILKREGQLITIAERILQEVAHMRAQLDPQHEAARFELDYRRAVVRHLDELELFGSGMSVTSRKYSLSLAYITLSLEQKVDYIDQPIDKCTDASFPLQEEETAPRSIRRIISVNELLSDAQCVLIRGDAGSGKTTLLQWIAVQSASQSFSPQLRTWNTTVPFYIRLRQHVPVDPSTTPDWPTPEEFPRLVASNIAGSMPLGWAHQKLKNGCAIVLIDGIDEVPPSQRESVYVWLKDLVEAYPQTRFIVTSRPYAIEEGGLHAEGFKDALLQPMELPDIETFIDQWHKAIAANIQDHEEQALMGEAAERLKKEMRHNRAQRALATNPLLCAMLCALNRERHQQLPSDRIALYEACCELLIERRDAERRISLIEYPAATLSYAQKSLLLADLAYWFIRNGWSEAPLPEIDKRFDWRLAHARETQQKFCGADVRLLFVQRSGIIREPVTGFIDFAHRTFQEFLAAKAVVDEGDIGVLVQHAHDDQWREVLLLAAGLASKKDREDLVERLIGRGETEKGYRSQFYLLAAACAESSHEKVGLSTKLRVERHLGALVPLKNLKEVEALATTGELALPYLYPRTQYPANVVAACVRVLTHIGSEAALKVLTEYTNDLTPEVLEAMIARLRNVEDKRAYAQRYLSHIKKLRLRSLTALEGLQYLPHLSSLELGNLSKVTDLAVLERLPQLPSLQLWDLPQVSDLAVLERLPQLSSLHLRDLPKVSDLAVLERLPQLSSLHLRDLPKVSDLAVLERLPQLSSLHLRDLPQVYELGTLAHLTHLTELVLGEDVYLPDLNMLVHLSNLKSIELNSFSHDVALPPEIKEIVRIRRSTRW